MAHKKHHSFKKTHIEHHADGSATVHHEHESDPKHDVKHAVSGLEQMHDSMQDHLGTPNPGEAEADAGDHGVPAAQAAPAGLPMPGAAPAGAGV
jgi:hypothetical protein